jgi:hypothetical protein
MELVKLIEATVESSKRSRQVVFIIILASVIAFCSYWNSRNESWIESRYQALSEVYGTVKGIDTFLYIQDKNICSTNYIPDTLNQFLIPRNIKTKQDIKDLRSILNDLRKDTYLVKVPFLGIVFDINDLCIFSGLTFTFLLETV